MRPSIKSPVDTPIPPGQPVPEGLSRSATEVKADGVATSFAQVFKDIIVLDSDNESTRSVTPSVCSDA